MVGSSTRWRNDVRPARLKPVHYTEDTSATPMLESRLDVEVSAIELLASLAASKGPIVETQLLHQVFRPPYQFVTAASACSGVMNWNILSAELMA